MFYSQIDDCMKTCLAKNDDWQKIHNKKDQVCLLSMLQIVNSNYQSNQELVLSMFTAKSDFMQLHQSKHQSVQDFYKKFMELLTLVLSSISCHIMSMCLKLNNLTGQLRSECMEFITCCLLNTHLPWSSSRWSIIVSSGGTCLLSQKMSPLVKVHWRSFLVDRWF